MTEQPTFDPRFDPAFQRGYEPPARETPPAPAEASGPDGAPTVSDKPCEQPRPAEFAPAVEEAAAEPSQPEPSQPEPAQPEPAQPNHALSNSFERTLGVVAAALVIAGVSAALWANNSNYNGPGQTWGWHQALQSVVWALSSPMITVGLATGVGLVFRRAIVWEPRE